MKKCICFLVLLAFLPNVHADNDKKKKSQDSQGSGKKPAATASGGSHAAGMPHMGSVHSKAPTQGKQGQANFSSKNRPGSSSASHVTSQSNSNPPTGKAGSSGTAGSNPLMRRGGQPKANAKSNPLTQKNNQTAAKNPMLKGGQGNNPAGQKGGTQLGRNANSANSMAQRNTRNMTARGVNRAVVHAPRANYHVRPYREVFRGYHPIRHDRGWYTAHYDRLVIVGGGYYYWDAGYWYPAWGYDPAFSLYVYDGPIYSYDNLPPDQVIVNVQTELQDQGYYTGEVDGQLGPQTRDALGAFQADHNLEVTSAVDQPTVEALGLSEST